MKHHRHARLPPQTPQCQVMAPCEFTHSSENGRSTKMPISLHRLHVTIRNLVKPGHVVRGPLHHARISIHVPSPVLANDGQANLSNHHVSLIIRYSFGRCLQTLSHTGWSLGELRRLEARTGRPTLRTAQMLLHHLERGTRRVRARAREARPQAGGTSGGGPGTQHLRYNHNKAICTLEFLTFPPCPVWQRGAGTIPRKDFQRDRNDLDGSHGALENSRG